MSGKEMGERGEKRGGGGDGKEERSCCNSVGED